ncbi:MAG: hypothetical protein V5A43_06960 [Haloarculaceae archaeon]
MHDGYDDAAQGIAPAGEPTDEAQRYGAIEMDHGEFVIYDRDAPSAWLQSNLAVAIEA